jgi:hypothetical protein
VNDPGPSFNPYVAPLAPSFVDGPSSTTYGRIARYALLVNVGASLFFGAGNAIQFGFGGVESRDLAHGALLTGVCSLIAALVFPPSLRIVATATRRGLVLKLFLAWIGVQVCLFVLSKAASLGGI